MCRCRLEQRVWFNSELRSRNFLVPGLVAVIMTLIGALLTAMVMSREWERGTMEALLVTPLSMSEVILGKLIPYFMLGMGGLLLAVGMALFLFEVPLRGSLWVLFAASALFLVTALGMGLLISTVARSQFVAGQIALITTFLPAFLLSGFIFDIGSMPAVVQAITHVDRRALLCRHPADRVPCRECLERDPAERAGAGDPRLGVSRPDLAQCAQAAGVIMLGRIFALVKKEFLTLLKDKRSRMVLIGPPLIQLMVFGYAATFDLKNVPFAVYNEDRGAASRQLLAAFDGSPSFTQVAQITHESEIAPLIDSKQVLMVMHAGPQFSADLLGGRPAELQVIVDGRNSNTAMLAINDVSVMVERFNRDWAASHDGTLPPAHIETRAWFNPNLESRWFFVPGIVGILTLLVTMLVTALSVAREREQGTFDQLLVTPLRPVEILIGKTLPGFIIGLAEASVIMLAAVLWFKVPLLGSLFTLYTGIFAVPAVRRRRGIDDLLVCGHPAAGIAGRVHLHGAGHHPVRFRDADPQHAGAGAGHHAARSDALFPGGAARRVPRGHAVPSADPAVLADGADRYRRIQHRRLAVPAPHVLMAGIVCCPETFSPNGCLHLLSQASPDLMRTGI